MPVIETKPLLAIETSCDECSASVARLTDSGVQILSNAVYSQIELHRPFGGVVPEVASRNHLEMINPIIEEALAEAKINFSDLSAIAVTNRPGLIGALLVGVSAAKALAYSLKIPLISVNHLEGHLHSIFIADQKKCDSKPLSQQLPLLVCLVSGGHSNLYLIESLPENGFKKTKISESRDDAAGEAFDKSAKLLGLPYPGGKYIDSLGAQGNPKAFAFPRPLAGEMDFSFSGLKTAVAQQIQKLGYVPHVFGIPKSEELPQGQILNDLCASVQEAIVDCLMTRIHNAIKDLKPKSVAIVGGVSANSRLRQRLNSEIKLPLLTPDLKYCTDNAAMIAAAAVYKQHRREVLDTQSMLSLNAFSTSE